MKVLQYAKIGDYTLYLRLFISPTKEAYRIFISGLTGNVS